MNASIDAVPSKSESETRVDDADFDLTRWPMALVRKHQLALLSAPDALIEQAIMVSPLSPRRMSLLEGRLGKAVKWREMDQPTFEHLLAQVESTRLIGDQLAIADDDNRAESPDGEILSLERLDDVQSPVVKAVNASLYDALRLGASDVHFESTVAGLSIRYRLDGVLIQGAQYAGRSLAEQVISRIKVMAELDIAERRIPQDGRFIARANDRRIDFRVSVMPSALGEDAVIRILDKQQLVQDLSQLSLSALGFNTDAQRTLRRLANLPHGMLLVTGPTGSGKTTTLYGLLSEVHSEREKLITIEDPIEYQIPGVLQIPVNERKGLTFAKGLRSILRHDPDRIMIGEIRDSDTAEIAIQSALTGHTVFATVHANNTFDVVGRFSHMSVDLGNFVTALNGVVAQRLIRLLCEHCSVAADIPTSNWDEVNVPLAERASWALRRATGCVRCNQTGYRGRQAIAEYLTLDDAVRQCIRDRAPLAEFKAHARRLGLTTLREAAFTLAKTGKTSLSECNRVSMAD